jgi:hypothetical protein
MFSASSRYHDIATGTTVRADGRAIRYVLRRFLPLAPPSAVIALHTVVQGDRLDNVTARHLGDPELFWQVCDANGATIPAALTAEDRLGTVLVIPLVDGGR